MKTYDISESRILEVLKDIPREAFVPEDRRREAYGDHPLPIGHGQTISQPYIVGKMTEILRPNPEDTVLEIGTGSGYQAAVLSRLVRHVYSVEIVPELADRAEQCLANLDITNVTVIRGDGNQGHPEQAPYPKIILTAAPQDIPSTLINQLDRGGCLIAPVGPTGDTQHMIRLTRDREGTLHREKLFAVRFVPFV